MEESIREIFYYKHYYREFFDALKPEAKKKFNWTLKLLTCINRIPEKFLKHIEGSSGLYEIRVEASSDIYIGCSAFLIRGKLLCWATGSKRRPPKHLKTS